VENGRKPARLAMRRISRSMRTPRRFDGALMAHDVGGILSACSRGVEQRAG
jgi:hypothetical protein